nr:hypothetical transcript [Hymenolepis microstoma]
MSSRRFIIPWPVSDSILESCFDYFHLLFENEANGGSEIIIFYHPRFFRKIPVLIENIPLEPSTYLSDIIMPINPQNSTLVNYFEILRLFVQRYSERREYQGAVWPEAISIVSRSLQHPYLLFEHPSNGGTEIIVYFDDPVFAYIPPLAHNIPLSPSTNMSNILAPILHEIYRLNNNFGGRSTYVQRRSFRHLLQMSMLWIERDLNRIRTTTCRNSIRQLSHLIRLAIKRKRNIDYRLIKVICGLLYRRSPNLMLTQ